MIENLLVYEREAFFALNGSNSPFLDRFMYIYTGKVVWLPLAILILAVLVYKKDWRESLLVLLAITLVVTLCDQFASHLCKPLFMRFRPTHHPDFMDQVKTVFGYRGGLYGFISSHAANAFGFAMFMSLLFRRQLLAWTLFLWAVLTAYTRVYLGVHFITDIVPGAIAGLIIGFIVYQIYQYSRKKWLGNTVCKPQKIYSLRRSHVIVAGLLLTVIVIILFNVPLTSHHR